MQDIIQYIIFGGGLFAIISLYYFTFHQTAQANDWQDLPYLQEYLNKHPECQTNNDNQIKCFYCQAIQIKPKASPNTQHHQYKHICIACSRPLFRSRTL